MMCLSQTAGYAIHALSIVARAGGQLCLIREIARLSGIPKPYLAKIINQLSREGLVAAKRGYRGGIYLTRSPEKISLLEITEAIEGEDFIAECMLGLDDCSTPCLCPTHDMWQRLRGEIKEGLRQATLADILRAVSLQSASPSAAMVQSKPKRKPSSRRTLAKVRNPRRSGVRAAQTIPRS